MSGIWRWLLLSLSLRDATEGSFAFVSFTTPSYGGVDADLRTSDVIGTYKSSDWTKIRCAARCTVTANCVAYSFRKASFPGGLSTCKLGREINSKSRETAKPGSRAYSIVSREIKQ